MELNSLGTPLIDDIVIETNRLQLIIEFNEATKQLHATVNTGAEVHLKTGESNETISLVVTPESGRVFELVTLWYTETEDGVGDGREMHVSHLDAPPSQQGIGWGRLGVMVVYGLCVMYGVPNYSMQFGGGEESEAFLHSIGFADFDTAVVQVAEPVPPSVVVGRVEPVGEGPFEWRLHPLPVEEFPDDVGEISRL